MQKPASKSLNEEHLLNIPMVNSTQLTQAGQKHFGVANLTFQRPRSDQLPALSE